MKYKRRLYWENKENTFKESKKYSSRTEFCKKSHGAYTVAKNNGWLNEMTWLDRKNVYKDPVDVVYKYHFVNENAMYIGRTIYPSDRDNQHRIRENDTVYKFAKEHNIEIPKMEIIEDKLTITEGARREEYWAKFYKDKGITLINKQPCGSVGPMCKGKWSRKKCFDEAKNYKTRSEFQKNASRAYSISLKKGWLDEMGWLPKTQQYPNGYWNREHIIEEAKKYSTIKDFQEKSGGAFNAARRLGIINELDWLEKEKRLPFGYWKNKEHCIEEAKKYKSKKEFQTKNQSAYWASLKYGYLEEMPWLVKRKVSKRGSFKNNKEGIFEEAKKYKTRGEFQKNNKSAYSAALKYGWLDEMDWLPKGTNRPNGYWDNIENVINEAKKYSTKLEIRENEPYLYKIMFKKGYVNELDWLK